MKRRSLALFFPSIVALGPGCATGPERLVREQVRAYNARDLEWFVGLYSDDAAIHKLLTGELVGQGEAYFRDRYARRFTESTDLHATILGRIVMGEYVIDWEDVVRRRTDPKVSALAIYHVDQARRSIDHVWFVFDEDVNPAGADDARAGMARHADAIHRRNAAAYEATFAPDAKALNLPDGKTLSGSRDEIMADARPFLDGGQRLKWRIAEQIVFGNVVVNLEEQRVGDAREWTRRVVVYEIREGRIARSWIITDKNPA